jgi:hypothetical protein
MRGHGRGKPGDSSVDEKQGETSAPKKGAVAKKGIRICVVFSGEL